MANVFKSIVLHHVLLDNFSVATTFVAMLTHYAIFITMEFVQNVFLDINYTITTPDQLIWSVIQDNIFLIMFGYTSESFGIFINLKIIILYFFKLNMVNRRITKRRKKVSKRRSKMRSKRIV